MTSPPDAKVKPPEHEGREVGFGGIARRIERDHRRYRQRGEANSRMEAWLDKVMVEHTCPDCTVGGAGPADDAAVHRPWLAAPVSTTSGSSTSSELQTFLGTVKPAGARRGIRGPAKDRRVPQPLKLLGPGLDHPNLHLLFGTLSGGESQRIRLSTQIGSGLMDVDVLDEPSIGLHPKDNTQMLIAPANPAFADIGQHRRSSLITTTTDSRQPTTSLRWCRVRACMADASCGPGTLDDVLEVQGIPPTGGLSPGRGRIAMPPTRVAEERQVDRRARGAAREQPEERGVDRAPRPAGAITGASDPARARS